jgi:hypothetical protein
LDVVLALADFDLPALALARTGALRPFDLPPDFFFLRVVLVFAMPGV